MHYLMMDAKGSKFVYRKIWYAYDSKLGNEGRILRAAEEMGHPNFVRSLRNGEGVIWGAFREHLEVEDSLGQLASRLHERVGQDRSAAQDARRFAVALYQMGDALAAKGFRLPSPDMSFGEFLLVRTPSGIRLKMTDMEHGGFDTDPQEFDNRTVNRNRIYNLLEGFYGFDGLYHPLQVFVNLANVVESHPPLGRCRRTFAALRNLALRFKALPQ